MSDDEDGPEKRAPTSGARVFTIGHSTRSFGEVVDMLRANGVTQLVDVRSLPGSRRYPQWDQENIRAAMPDDIGYRWLRALGGRRYTPVGAVSPNTFWRVKAFRDYADYMATPPFRDGLRQLLDVASVAVPAIMCSEAVPWRCHRRLITDALVVAGASVFDILSAMSTRAATLTASAAVDEGVITYPA